ncbi:MAG: hypothetical protein JWL70_2754 [Acidimicrobiia bacterium]|nr:hypothetical protein [Acidimicrobiia bacterium]
MIAETGDPMTSTIMATSQAPTESHTRTDLGQVVAALALLAHDVDHLWRAAQGSLDFDTWNRLTEASHSVHRALNCLTLDPVAG